MPATAPLDPAPPGAFWATNVHGSGVRLSTRALSTRLESTSPASAGKATNAKVADVGAEISAWRGVPEAWVIDQRLVPIGKARAFPPTLTASAHPDWTTSAGLAIGREWIIG